MTKLDESMERVPNLGPKSAAILLAVGVETLGDLRAIGVVEAFMRAKIAFPAVTLNLLWGLEGAAEGISWKDISPERKAALKRAVADVL